jgi:eukaryotic-like serine/threonine-protein kinase
MADGDFIDYLVAHGAYVEAARVAAARGELARAITLYERVWRFAEAWPLALALGDRALAVRLALDANQPDRAAEIAATTAPESLPAIAEAFAGRGRFFEAARQAERAGDWGRAASWYGRAGAPLEEARAATRAGRLREAGLIYERLIAQGSPEEAHAARFSLGRLLARVGRTEDAVRHLQAAARVPGWQTQAWRALCRPLLTLGLRGAAAELADRLRARDPASPATPDEVAALDDAEGQAAPAARAGELAGRYQLRRLLGAGAVGRVYEAFDSLLGVPIALKLVAVGGGGESERQAYVRFAREADAAGRLRHPNIVALIDAHAGAGLFVFELMTGGTLADRLADAGPLPPAAARRLALDLLAALAVAHERGIVHRDVKPANVFFDAAGNAKLGDFGSAHLADFGQTQTGGFFGTVAYMSPEQITGAPIGLAADLYALGATLMEALTGRPPFLGPDLVAQHLGEPAPPPSSRRPDLSPAHDQVLARALAKVPAERFGSALEMAEAIATWPVEAAAAWTRAPVPERAPRPAPADSAPAAERELARTADARILLRHDPRGARELLVEERSEPVEGAALDELRHVAAAGGPYTQRVLALSTDRRSISYEIPQGALEPLSALTATERDLLAPSLQALPPGRATHFVRTAAGPVIWTAPVVSSTSAE